MDGIDGETFKIQNDYRFSISWLCPDAKVFGEVNPSVDG